MIVAHLRRIVRAKRTRWLAAWKLNESAKGYDTMSLVDLAHDFQEIHHVALPEGAGFPEDAAALTSVTTGGRWARLAFESAWRDQGRPAQEVDAFIAAFARALLEAHSRLHQPSYAVALVEQLTEQAMVRASNDAELRRQFFETGQIPRRAALQAIKERGLLHGWNDFVTTHNALGTLEQYLAEKKLILDPKIPLINRYHGPLDHSLQMLLVAPVVSEPMGEYGQAPGFFETFMYPGIYNLYWSTVLDRSLERGLGLSYLAHKPYTMSRLAHDFGLVPNPAWSAPDQENVLAGTGLEIELRAVP
jgi:hypothetical protein